MTANIPYGSRLYCKPGSIVSKDTMICEWDPFNAVIIAEEGGKVRFENVEEGVTFRVEGDDSTNLHEKIMIESKDRTKVPSAQLYNEDGELIRSYSLPVGAHLLIDEGDTLTPGQVFVKIPRSAGSAGDITGGLPRVTELFEARNPSNPAVVSEIDGEVSFGKIKRGNREISASPTNSARRRNTLCLSPSRYLFRKTTMCVQEHLYPTVPITPTDILNIKGPTAVQEYIVNEVQDVYRMQGVKINDKHFEVIVRQMMRKVNILDPGDTRFLEQQVVDKREFMEENDYIWGKKYIIDAGDSTTYLKGQIITQRKLRDENSVLKRNDKKIMTVRDAVPLPPRNRFCRESHAPRSDVKLHLRGILPGDNQGAQRSCHQRQERHARGYERERDLRTPHSRRNRPT